MKYRTSVRIAEFREREGTMIKRLAKNERKGGEKMKKKRIRLSNTSLVRRGPPSYVRIIVAGRKKRAEERGLRRMTNVPMTGRCRKLA